MASQEDYANVLLALTTLATAPVAAYPESGPMMLAQQGQDRAVGKLADEAMKKAQKKAKKKGKLGAIGQAVGTVGGTLIGGPIGGAVGGQLGQTIAGGGDSFGPQAISAAFAESAAAAEGTKQYAAARPRRSSVSRSRKIPSRYLDTVDGLSY